MLLVLFGDGVVANMLLSKAEGQNSGWIVITSGWANRHAVADGPALCPRDEASRAQRLVGRLDQGLGSVAAVGESMMPTSFG